MFDFVIRTAGPGDLALFTDWAAREGWNPGRFDIHAFHAVDPDGFLVGTLAGEPVSLLSCVRHSADYGFVGFYIVRPESRGEGYGLRTWRHGLARLGDRTLALDAVLAQVPNYERSGFRRLYDHVRYTAMGGGTLPDAVTPLRDVPFEHLREYDAACFPCGRPGLLRALIDQPGAAGYATLEGERVTGYGLTRRAVEGWRVGPLFADDADTADLLYRALRAFAPRDPVSLDLPANQPAAVALAKRHQMAEGFRCARMVRGVAPPMAYERVYGVTSLEVG